MGNQRLLPPSRAVPHRLTFRQAPSHSHDGCDRGGAACSGGYVFRGAVAAPVEHRAAACGPAHVGVGTGAFSFVVTRWQPRGLHLDRCETGQRWPARPPWPFRHRTCALPRSATRLTKERRRPSLASAPPCTTRSTPRVRSSCRIRTGIRFPSRTLVLSERRRPSDSPTRSLTRRFAGALRLRAKRYGETSPKPWRRRAVRVARFRLR
jgi:hypothetical protein